MCTTYVSICKLFAWRFDVSIGEIDSSNNKLVLLDDAKKFSSWTATATSQRLVKPEKSKTDRWVFPVRSICERFGWIELIGVVGWNFSDRIESRRVFTDYLFSYRSTTNILLLHIPHPTDIRERIKDASPLWLALPWSDPWRFHTSCCQSIVKVIQHENELIWLEQWITRKCDCMVEKKHLNLF